MDALEFLKEQNRMCEKYKYSVGLNCSDCPCNGTDETCVNLKKSNPEKYVAIVEKWSKDHPAKTRQSELLKMFPYAPTTVENGALKICPKNVDEKRDFSCARPCSVCLKEYWFSEVE